VCFSGGYLQNWREALVLPQEELAQEATAKAKSVPEKKKERKKIARPIAVLV
jgi:hypothetical protein